MKLWLDDIRPAPPGWYHVTTVEHAKVLFAFGEVEEASLDHDLGACINCLEKFCPDNPTPEGWLVKTNYTQMPHCEHVGTGWDLVKWMIEEGMWPHKKPTVHSANPIGAERMRTAIDRYFGTREGE